MTDAKGLLVAFLAFGVAPDRGDRVAGRRGVVSSKARFR